MKLLLIFLLVMVLLLQVFTVALPISDSMHSQTDQVPMDGGATGEDLVMKKFPPRRINCGYACATRCRKATRKNVCHRTCMACCARCNCVPPGTYGNKEVCPCYARLTTRGNKPKCP